MLSTHRVHGALIAGALSTMIAIGCGSSSEEATPVGGTDQDGGTGEGGPLTEGGIGTEGGTPGEGGVVDTPFGKCTPGTTQCTNCVDDDKDGSFDWQDPECTGPLDNDESSFATGISGDNVDACKQDCYFDGNSGSGNDGCLWEVGCQRPNPDPTNCPNLDPSSNQCTNQTPQKCLDFCLPVTPNGCDCFGCCAIPRADGGQAFVMLTSTCNSKLLDDPTKCVACQQKADCVNTCGHCELCVGKTELPADCKPGATDSGTPDSGGDSGGGTGQVCQNGQQICNAATLCVAGYSCVTGCCVPQLK